MMDDRESRITVEPDKKRGFPCIRGMRISVKNVMEMLDGGMTEDEILADFPYLQPEDLRAARLYTARYGSGMSSPWSAFAGDRLR